MTDQSGVVHTYDSSFGFYLFWTMFEARQTYVMVLGQGPTIYTPAIAGYG